jgi:cbb3-type cytochrome oxidase maturation protein
MDSLYLLIPLSLLLVLAIGGVLAWAVLSGQFDGLEGEGRRIVDEPSPGSPSGPPRED